MAVWKVCPRCKQRRAFGGLAPIQGRPVLCTSCRLKRAAAKYKGTARVPRQGT